MINNECYTFKQYIFNDYLFKNINATYIIHLENNGRLEHIYEQLSIFHPTSILYLLINKGYKNCIKDKNINIPPLDLVDAFITIFKHAKIYNYEYILILEDDFIFNIKLNDKILNIPNQIDNFLDINKNEEFIYYLGCIPGIQSFNYFNYHNKLYSSIGTHACIYSKKIINNIQNVNIEDITDWDTFLNRNFNYERYIYYEPLCYQLFTETNNSKYWGRHHIFDNIGSNIIKKIFKIFKLDIQIEPGYTILYHVSKILYIIIIISLICLIYYILKY